MESSINFIRDILRKEGITGMDSISHCIVFLVSRMLNKELCKKLDINEQLSFDNIRMDKNGEELGTQGFYSRIYNGKPECLVGQIAIKLGFKNIKFKLEGVHNLQLIYDKLKKLDVNQLSTKCDLIGVIYELHLKSGTSSSLRDLGQYYTNRLVIDYMVKLCDPKMTNGIIEKIVDPTMGTGGFLTMAIKYLNEKYENKINWNKNKDNIFGFDIDENVKNMALLNIFLEINELCQNTIVKQDTLHCDMKFPYSGTILEKADVILANEPMGLKNITHASCCERIKNMKIRGTKAEPLFLQLFMSALNENGRCSVIVPDGVLFNVSNLHLETRQHLIENFNLSKIVSLNDNFFLNTDVKTSILFFTKDGNKTKIVDFCEIKLVDGKIKETSIIKVKYDEIKTGNYTLFVNKFNSTTAEKINGIKYKELGNVCELKNGKSFDKKDIIEGEYPVIGGGMKPIGYHNDYNVNENTIIISKDGANAGYISKYNSKAMITSHGIYILNFCESVVRQYVYYYLKIMLQDKIYELQTGSAQPGVNKKNIEKLELPIPSLVIQKIIVEQLDVLSSSIERLKLEVDGLLKIIGFYMACKTKNEQMYKLDDICNINPENMSGIYDFINYIDIGSVDNGKLLEINKLVKNFPSRAKRLIKKDDILISTVRPNLKNYVFLNENIENGVCSTGFCVIRSKAQDKYLSKMIYYQIQSNDVTEYLVNNATGSQYPAVTSTIIGSVKIKIPPIEKQQEIIKYCDNIVNIIDILNRQIKDNEKLMKDIMNTYLAKEKHDKSNESKPIKDKKKKSEIKTYTQEEYDKMQLDKKIAKFNKKHGVPLII